MIAAAPAGLPAVPAGGCPVLLSSVCTGATGGAAGAAGGLASGVLGTGAGAVLSAMAGWVTSGAAWLLGQVGAALSATTTVDLGAGWFQAHYAVMLGLAGVVVLPLLLAAVVQAVYRQSADALVRVVVVQLPLAAILGAAAVQLVRLALAATDALSATAASGSGGHIRQALSGLAIALLSGAGGPPAPPAFVVLLGGLLVALGAFALWVELLVRTAAVYVAVLFLPLGLASMVWPAVSHWCRRLVETLAALILAKFVIVVVLALAASALASGTTHGFSAVLGGGALLLLATFVPFALLRLIPLVEAGAVHHLEGVRHRATAAAGGAARTATSLALRAAGAAELPVGEAGTGLATTFEAPGESGTTPPGHRDQPRPSGASGPPGGSGPSGSSGHASSVPPPEGGGAGAGGTRGPGAGATGFTGLPLWRGVEPSGVPGAAGPDSAGGPGSAAGPGSGDPARVPMSRGGDPSGRGPIPLWGAPVEDLGPPAGADRRPRGRFEVGTDAMGPVLQWVPDRTGAECQGGR